MVVLYMVPVFLKRQISRPRGRAACFRVFVKVQASNMLRRRQESDRKATGRPQGGDATVGWDSVTVDVAVVWGDVAGIWDDVAVVWGGSGGRGEGLKGARKSRFRGYDTPQLKRRRPRRQRGLSNPWIRHSPT